MSQTDLTSLTEVIRGTRHLLLDFDGPVCNAFAGYAAATMALELRQLIADQGVVLPSSMIRENDPLQVLRDTPSLGGPELARLVADAFRDLELAAIESAERTPHLTDVLSSAKGAGVRLGIVSNNSRQAVVAYLERHGLRTCFTKVIGRYDGMDPRYLKPSAHLVVQAMTGMGAPPERTSLVGDAVSDINAAHSALIGSIGYANKPGKRAVLKAAGAKAVINSMAELAAALQDSPRS